MQDFDDENLQAYLRKLVNIPEITQEQEEQLIEQMEQGKKAQEKLIEAHLRLVVSIAKTYEGRGPELLDLIRTGNEGLAKAVEYYDASKEPRLNTYATWWIRQAITKKIAESK